MIRNTPTLSASYQNNVTEHQFLAAIFAILLTFALPTQSNAQGPQFGLTVQLPTVRNFSVQTAVSVPDGGTISLGGISRSAEGRVSRGVPGLPGRPFRNDAIGRSTNVGRATATTRIIIQSELEEDLLANANRQSRMKQQAKDFLDGKSDRLPFRDEKQTVRSSPETTRPPISSRDQQIDAFANFLAANIGRRL